MLEIRITAPELSEALNNLARSINLAVTNHASAAANEQTAQNQVTAPAPTPTAVPSTPISAAPTAPAVPSEPSATYPIPDTPAQPVPTAAPQYTLDMIAKAGTALIDAGKMNELTALLARYGVEALTALDPSHYGAFVAELRSMGAMI